MRVLFYNWIDYLDAENRGGGVSIYQKNVIAELQYRSDVEVSFVSAGISYDIPGKPPRWERLRHGKHTNRQRHFEIVNSGVLAPAHHCFGDRAQMEHVATQEAFFDFLEQTGPYDVVHFNNFEGLPASVLSLKARWPRTKVIFSLHNYYPFCPQVNFWHKEAETCEDFASGSKCVDCLTGGHDSNHVKLANGLAYNLKRLGLNPGSRAFHYTFVWTMRVGRRAVGLLKQIKRLLRRKLTSQHTEIQGRSQIEKGFVTRRHTMVEVINQNCDLVLCVSDAVRDIAIRYGLKSHLCTTSYIGTRQADAFKTTEPRSTLLGRDGTLSLGYLGYMRRDKGFHFLLEALETLPAELSSRVSLTVAARKSNDEMMSRLHGLEPQFAEIKHVDGYSHDDLDDLLAGIDVGVVPVLWHDNLPQVAIELHSRHIPLLTADMGGAKELSNCPEMTFPAGDIHAFHARIAALLNNEVDISEYWASARTPTTMDVHINELLAHYSADPPSPLSQ